MAEPRQNQPTRQGGQTKPPTPTRKSIGAIIREELESAIRQKVRGAFEGSPMSRVTAATVNGLVEAVKNKDLDGAIDIAVTGGVTISYLQRIMSAHPDLFQSPVERTSSWLEGVIDALAPGFLPAADDPEVIALEARLHRNRRS
jgi:hypothetical protein